MRTFILTSNRFSGEVKMKFKDDSNRTFAGIDFSHSAVSEKQQVWFLKHLPSKTGDLQFYKSSEIEVNEIIEECTFQAFWNKYDDILNSSKKKTEAKWNKMKQIEQIKAFKFISVYFANIPPGTRKKYAETYLNSELWNN